MAQFQTRRWLAWYHQITLIMLLLLFVMKEKLFNFEKFPILSAWDMRQLMMVLFMNENRSEDILTIILERHKKRQKDINYYYSSG